MMKMIDASEWEDVLDGFSHSHLLQTRQWAQVKQAGGWHPFYSYWGDLNAPRAAALILIRTVSLVGVKLRVVYLPKGPLLKDWQDAALRGEVLTDLAAFGKRKGAIFVKMDPDIVLSEGSSNNPMGEDNPAALGVIEDLAARGWGFSNEQIQFRNTVLIDLTLEEEDLLAQMKQKTRYNIRLAGRKGVTVREGGLDDLPLLYRMYAETSLRDGFAIRGEDYYQLVWKNFMTQDEPGCTPLIAEVEGEAVAAIVLFRFSGKAYYLHGMSLKKHRNKMPNYLLQWEAIRRAKNAGCTVYDLWGAPDVFDDSDPMWGVFRFKQGLGGRVLRTPGAYDLPLRPAIYKLYTEVLPWILDKMRLRGKSRTQESIRG